MARKFWWLPLIVLLCVFTGLWRARRSAFEVDVRGADVHIDKINLAIPMLERAIKEHPQASTYRVCYRMVPDAQQANVFLPQSIEYDRRAHILRWSREFWYEQYSGVTDEIIHAVAARQGGVRMLLRHGCRRTFPHR